MGKNSYVREQTCNARYSALHESIKDFRNNHLPHIIKKIDRIQTKMNGALIFTIVTLVTVLVGIAVNYLR